MLECSPLELQVTTLGEEIRKLGRRINAIEEYLIPRLREEIAFIKSVLEEREREERFRLKRVKKKKSRAKEGNG
jgi:V/A-type H+-transporting ATPase subunit D